jgi:CHAT domain-containing protein
VTSIEEIQNKIDRNAVLIEYSVLDSLLLIYFTDREKSDVVSVALQPGFEDMCNEFYSLITDQSFSNGVRETHKKYTQLGFELYKILIEPIKDQFQAENLIIVPDGAISYIPFDALLTSRADTGKFDYRQLPYFIRQYSTGYSYSSTLHFNPIQHTRIQSEAVLAFAPSYPEGMGRDIRFNFNRKPEIDQLLSLPGVKDEVKRISKIVKTDVFNDSEATEENFKRLADRYKILHLAMHTLIDDDNPMFSRLAFTQPADTTEDNFLHTYEIYNMKFNASLAILSSCSSGYGKIQEGEGIQSLARGFAYAGCPSILMTLWEVADLSTVFVMEKFYEYLKVHDPKPVALRKSKLDFLAEADQLRSNPFFWSSYVIIGDSNPVYPFKPGILIINFILLIIPLGYLGILQKKYRNENKRKRIS